MKKRPLFIVLGVAIASWLATAARAAETARTVKVFILAGQSNMEGKAPNSLLDYQAEAPKTKDLFKHLRKDGKWIVRDDVFIKYLDRKGPLTIGYGSPGRTGVELEFGTMMGDHFHAAGAADQGGMGRAFAGQALPLALGGLSGDAILQAELEQAQDRVKKNNAKNRKQRSAADDGRHQEGRMARRTATCWPR